jgi:hypothetical protein
MRVGPYLHPSETNGTSSENEGIAIIGRGEAAPLNVLRTLQLACVAAVAQHVAVFDGGRVGVVVDGSGLRPFPKAAPHLLSLVRIGSVTANPQSRTHWALCPVGALNIAAVDVARSN